MRMGRRWCCGCVDYLVGDLDELFYKNSHRKDGLSTNCRLCTREYSKRYYQEHKQHIIDRVSRWRQENPTKARRQRIRDRKAARVRERLKREAARLHDDF